LINKFKINFKTKSIIYFIVILITLICLIVSIFSLQNTVTQVEKLLNEKRFSLEQIKSGNGSLISIISADSVTDPALREALKNHQVLANGSAKLSVQDTGFNQLISIIENLEKTYNINLYSAEIDSGKSSGNVNAILEFQNVTIK